MCKAQGGTTLPPLPINRVIKVGGKNTNVTGRIYEWLSVGLPFQKLPAVQAFLVFFRKYYIDWHVSDMDGICNTPRPPPPPPPRQSSDQKKSIGQHECILYRRGGAGAGEVIGDMTQISKNRLGMLANISGDMVNKRRGSGELGVVGFAKGVGQ